MPQPAWMEEAWAEIGQREQPGIGDNPRIIALYRDAGHASVRHDEIAWCAAFVGAALQRAGHAGTGSLLARSYLAWGEKLAEGRLGAVAVFSRGSDPAAGHVGFFLDADASRVFVLGGNQSDAVTVTTIERSRLLGLRWPMASTAPSPPPEIAAPGELFDTALGHVLEMEGGWTEDPYDPGGPTNHGITLATLAAHRGVTLDAAAFAGLRQELRQLGDAETRTIYLARYWTPCRADALAPALALMHFDAAVNHGVAGAARMLQQAAGVTVDGDIGPATLAACASGTVEDILKRYAEVRRARYRALGHFWRFGRGWLARVDATLRLAVTLPTNPPTGVTTMSEVKNKTASTNATTSPLPTVKWFGDSMTLWGALITAASTVVPALGPLVGIDITAEMVRQLGTQGVQSAQAIGGLVGTLMTIFGRARATAPLRLTRS